MNCTVEGRDAIFIGLLTDERGDTLAVVKFFGHGMYVNTYHPSKVMLNAEG